MVQRPQGNGGRAATAQWTHIGRFTVEIAAGGQVRGRDLRHQPSFRGHQPCRSAPSHLLKALCSLSALYSERMTRGGAKARRPMASAANGAAIHWDGARYRTLPYLTSPTLSPPNEPRTYSKPNVRFQNRTSVFKTELSVLKQNGRFQNVHFYFQNVHF